LNSIVFEACDYSVDTAIGNHFITSFQFFQHLRDFFSGAFGRA